MSRQVNIIIPLCYSRIVLDELEKSTIIFHINSFITQNLIHISFKVRSKHLQEIINKLTKIGCGEAYGSIDVYSLVMSRPIIDKEKSTKRLYIISDRMTIDEIQDMIEDGNHLTFDFLAQITLASLIAGAGLLEDNSTSVIASMLVSPLMGPILSMTFGLATNKYDIVRRGLRNELYGVAISLIVGLTMGFCASQFYSPDYISDEMESRGKAASLILGFFVAAPSGVGIILAISKGGFNAIVGTAISASLLPPVVNCGLYLGLGIIRSYNGIVSDNEDAQKFVHSALMSFLLWFVNFVVIVVVGFLTFRYIKNVRPTPLYGTLLHSSSSIDSSFHDEDDSQQYHSPLLNEIPTQNSNNYLYNSNVGENNNNNHNNNSNHNHNNNENINNENNVHISGDISSYLNPNYKPERWRVAPGININTNMNTNTNMNMNMNKIRSNSASDDINEEEDEIILNASHNETKARINGIGSRLNSNLITRDYHPEITQNTSFFIEK